MAESGINKPLDLTFVSVHPRFLDSYFQFGVFRSAMTQGLAEIRNIDLREFALDHRGSIDDKPYGGGDGMVMRPEPLARALKKSPDSHVILLSPKGKPCTHQEILRLKELALTKPLTFVCGRFGGVDQRFIDTYVDEEIAVGVFVVSGGELPALMVADGILRQIPGVLGHEESAANDSFGAGLDGKLEYPLYTRPPVFDGLEVPEVLLSGDHQAIAKWRREHLI